MLYKKAPAFYSGYLSHLNKMIFIPENVHNTMVQTVKERALAVNAQYYYYDSTVVVLNSCNLKNNNGFIEIFGVHESSLAFIGSFKFDVLGDIGYWHTSALRINVYIYKYIRIITLVRFSATHSAGRTAELPLRRRRDFYGFRCLSNEMRLKFFRNFDGGLQPFRPAAAKPPEFR